MTPKARETAMPLKMESPRMTLAPATSARAVMRMGRVRVLQAWITASSTDNPRRTAWMEKSTSRMELRTMMPASAIQPIIEVAVNSASKSQWPGMIPRRVRGMGAMIRAGIRKSPNSQTTRT